MADDFEMRDPVIDRHAKEPVISGALQVAR